MIFLRKRVKSNKRTKVCVCLYRVCVKRRKKNSSGEDRKPCYEITNGKALTLFAQSKHVDTTFDMIFIRFFVSCMTWSTFTNVADFPTVGSFTLNWSVCTYVGTLSK